MENDTRVVAHTATISQRYNQAMADHISALRELASRRQVDFAVARTDAPFYQLFDRLSA